MTSWIEIGQLILAVFMVEFLILVPIAFFGWVLLKLLDWWEGV